MPHNFCETSEGLLLIASGRDLVLRWDGLAAQAEPAGIEGPTAEFTMTAAALSSNSMALTAAQWKNLYTTFHTKMALSRSSADYGAMRLGYSGAPAYLAFLEGQYKLAEARELQGDVPQVISGTYYAYVRYIDKYGNFSSLSPIAGPLVMSATGAITAADGRVGPNVITAPGHGLSTGAVVTISGVAELRPSFSSTSSPPYTITVVDANTFTLNGTISSATFVGSIMTSSGWFHSDYSTATWSSVNHKIVYSSVPTTGDPKVVRRQILRNTAGQARVFYVDIDTQDLLTTSFSSTKSDSELQVGQFQSVLSPTGKSLIYEHGMPPNWKTAFVAQLGRVFCAVDLIYNEGAAIVTNGSTTVTGIATEWNSTFIGRFFYAIGGDKPYEITAVSEANQTLTLLETYVGTSDPFIAYAVRPPPAEARIVHYSGAFLPESWNPLDAFSLQDDGDELSGLMKLGSYLYILEKRHMYRFTFQSDPAEDGYPFLAAHRGCLNQRCFAVVEDRAYLLDEQGIHLFSGGESRSISEPIQDFFQRNGESHRVNWAAGSFFHCIHYQDQDVVKWFVALSGQYLPRHALVYDYRGEAWEVHEYAVPIACSSRAYIDNLPYVLIATRGKRTLADGERSLDGPESDQGTVRGTATGSTLLSLSDSLAVFASAGIVGNPVAIAEGRGKGQVRVVTAVSGTTLRIDRPWLVLPDTTSVYQLGGIPWKYRTGKFWYYDGSDMENSRRLAIAFTPTVGKMDMRLYEDRSEEPLEWGRNWSSSDTSGVQSVEGNSDLVADLTRTTGYVQKVFGGHREQLSDGPRCVSLELEGVKAEEGLVIHGITIDGVQK